MVFDIQRKLMVATQESNLALLVFSEALSRESFVAQEI